MQRPKLSKQQLPSLDSGPVPLIGIREAARKQLVDLIDTKRGKKALILDPTISGPLTQLDAQLSELFTEHGVVRLQYLERVRLDDPAYNTAEPKLSGVRPIIYIVRATLDNAQTIAWQVRNTPKAYQQHEISVFWVPRCSVACERLLEDEGVLGDLSQGEFPLELLPLDDDVMSLELEGGFKECTLEGDTSALFYVAAAIMKLQIMFGSIPRIQGKGPAASFVKETLIKLAREQSAPLPPSSTARINRVILIDREVDIITPMITQITFEGLIDEVTGIKNGAVPYTPSRDRKPGEGGSGGAAAAGAAGGSEGGRARSGSTMLNSSDPFYKEFRDLPYYITSQRLQQYAREARKEYAELGTKDLSQLKTFVKGLPKLLLLDRLSDIAVPVAEVVKAQSFHDRLKMELDIIENYDLEEAVKYCQTLMWGGSDMLSVLRLLVLLSVAYNGLPRKHLDPLRGELLSAYGHQHLLTLHSLEKAGLLRASGVGGGGGVSSSSSGRGGLGPLRKALRLVVQDDSQMDKPTDISYLYKGYAPLSIRLVEMAVQPGGWGGGVEGLGGLPGGQFDVEQVISPDGTLKVQDYRHPYGVIPPSTPAAGGTSSSSSSAATAGAAGGGGSSSSATPAAAAAAAAPVSPGRVENVLVVFLGGVTFSEISALRFLSSRPGAAQRYLVMTTKVINGRTLLETFIDPVVRNYMAGGEAFRLGGIA